MKRFFITLSITLACVLLFFVGFGVLLMLAPGSRFFGVSYVSATVGKNNVQKEWNEYFDGDIFVETKSCPIVINFKPFTQTKIEFNQNYSGFTLNEERVPNATIQKRADGIYVNTQEIEKFIIGSNRDYALTLTLPLVWAKSNSHSIFVNGQNSNVSINSSGETIKLYELNIKAQSLNLNTNFDITNLNLNISNQINLNEKQIATNISYTSNAGSLKIGYEVERNIEFNTKSGSLYFVSARSVKAKTVSGSILPYAENNSVAESAKIETSSGAVKINNLLGENNEISTSAGSVTIGEIYGGKISSSRGKISVDFINSCEIVGATGNVSVGTVAGSLKVSTNHGDISVGQMETGKSVNNIEATTTAGNINVLNSVGKVNLKTERGDIKLVNTSSREITINSGKNVNAVGLKGKVEVNASRNINVSFNGFTHNASILGGKGSSNINVSVSENDLVVGYEISTSKNAIVFEGEEEVISGQSLKNEGRPHKILINGQSALVKLFLAK